MAARCSCSPSSRIAERRRSQRASGGANGYWKVREDPSGKAYILPMLAALEAMDAGSMTHAHTWGKRDGRGASFPTPVRSRRVGRRWPPRSSCWPATPSAPRRSSRIPLAGCGRPVSRWLATNTALLSEALYRQGRFADALTQSGEALALAPPGHLTSLAVARRVHTMALARAGDLDEAAAIATATIDLCRRRTSSWSKASRSQLSPRCTRSRSGRGRRGSMGGGPPALRAEGKSRLGGSVGAASASFV